MRAGHVEINSWRDFILGNSIVERISADGREKNTTERRKRSEGEEINSFFIASEKSFGDSHTAHNSDWWVCTNDKDENDTTDRNKLAHSQATRSERMRQTAKKYVEERNYTQKGHRIYLSLIRCIFLLIFFSSFILVEQFSVGWCFCRFTYNNVKWWRWLGCERGATRRKLIKTMMMMILSRVCCLYSSHRTLAMFSSSIRAAKCGDQQRCCCELRAAFLGKVSPFKLCLCEREESHNRYHENENYIN